ncbi:NUDIX hydrolase [Spirilliplanes yamanashiensis]|uniref:Nudix hydrolase domain-containing protein n=1 Tax=Spirilliplanes yamanashiensis TaxID=42233 RepID=A0A8J4DK38_9ACTN|nr:NUDIX domain-containing protein [Spirilliplanes yamanashiensis]MDP9815690.1 ADP-ribose pyrophosphatase YjhB (NUDIX family) [Spirilliplanes yamanashiensis]GIJ03944.1 hypothetical protein Sya03_32960 [Spirilliplanes yamanashiensis]
MTEHPLSRAEFDAVYARVPRLTVEVVLRGAAGVVLTRRSVEPARGLWHLPGGTVHFGEPVTAAVRRVARAELGVDVLVGALLGWIEYPGLHAAGYPGWPVGLAFAATLDGGVPVAADQADAVGWFRSVPPDTLAEQAAFLRNLGI